MGFYDEMRAVATELLSGELGQSSASDGNKRTIEYVKITQTGTFDAPGAPTYTLTPLDATSRGASFKYVAKSLAQAGDMQVVSAIHPDVTPDARDSIDINGVRHKIVHIEPKPTAGAPVAWLFIVRKGG